jgi:hypothetical protein
LAVFGFKGNLGGVEQFPSRNDDQVEPWSDFVAAENLSNQPLRSVSLNGAPQFLRRGDAEPSDCQLVGQDEERSEATLNLDPLLINPLEV